MNFSELDYTNVTLPSMFEPINITSMCGLALDQIHTGYEAQVNTYFLLIFILGLSFGIIGLLLVQFLRKRSSFSSE